MVTTWGLPEPDIEYKLALRLLQQDPPLDRQVLETLVGKPHKYRDLRRLLKGRNGKVITKALARLVDDGLVDQGLDFEGTAQFRYQLTSLGKLVVFRLHEMIPHHMSIEAYERGRKASVR